MTLLGAPQLSLAWHEIQARSISTGPSGAPLQGGGHRIPRGMSSSQLNPPVLLFPGHGEPQKHLLSLFAQASRELRIKLRAQEQ